LLRIHLRAALLAAGGDVDRAARMLGLTPGDAARLFAYDPTSPSTGRASGQTSGTWNKIERENDDDESA
jgi:hypothetical protein